MHYQALKKVWTDLTEPGAPFELETITVRGTRVKSYKNMPANLREVWRTTASFAEQDYLVYQQERISYQQAHELCRRIAGWLTSQGIEAGDRVAISMRNYPEWMLIYWACVSSGITVVGLNAWWSDNEIEQALINSTPRVIFADHERLVQLNECSLPEQTHHIVAVRSATDNNRATIAWSDVTAHDGICNDCTIDPDADACLLYTSGTSGQPKGVAISHRNTVCNIYNVLFAAQSQELATTGAGAVPPATPAPVVALVTTPLFHVTANNCTAQIATVIGGTVVLMYRWNAATALSIIAAEGVTTMSGVPVMTRELIEHPDFATTDTSSLLSIGGGGAPSPPDLLEKIQQVSPTLRTSSGYGMTEASGLIASISGDFFTDRPTSSGPILPTFEAICVDDNGQALPAGQLGELWLKGASVVRGYFNDPQASAQAITRGWLHTGDIARIDDDGFLYIADRKKEMVLRGGENVFCADVEAALYRHPAVAECCCFAVPDQRLGETVGAAVFLKKDQPGSVRELQQHCKQLLANYKVPEHLWLLERPIPRNASGKFLKKELIKQLGVNH